jgi:MFS family permease
MPESGLVSSGLGRDVKLLLACNLVGSFGDGIYAFLLPVYMREKLGATPAEVGILYAVTNLSAAATLLLAGVLADRYDRKKVMIAGWLSWLPVPLIFSVARNWVAMLPGMVMWGFWLGGPSGTAYIITATRKEKVTLAFTAVSAMWSAGYVFSPAIGGYLAETIGMQFVFYSAFILYASACSILLLIRSQHVPKITEGSQEQHYSLLELLKNRKLLRLSIFFASIMFCLMMFRPLVSQFLMDMYHYNDFGIGFLGSVSFASSAVLGVAIGRFGDRKGKPYALTVLLILCSVSTTLLVTLGNFQILVLSFIAAGASYTIWSLMNAIVGPLAPENCRARWASVPQTVSMFSSIIAPYLGGALYETSPYYPFIAATIAMVLLATLTATKLKEVAERI